MVRCTTAPVTLRDNSVEPVYEQVLHDSAIKRRLYQVDFARKSFSIEDFFLLSLDRTELLAIAAERSVVADAQVRFFVATGRFVRRCGNVLKVTGAICQSE